MKRTKISCKCKCKCKPVVKKDTKLIAIKKAIDILVKARVAGAGVEVAKWAEERGYNLKGE